MFNNAGVGPWSAIKDTTLADWQWVLGVNLWGVINGIHYFLPIMQSQKDECHIVNTGSVGSLYTSIYHSLYSVSKFGIMALSEEIYRELKQSNSNVGISILCPHLVKTRIQEPERNRPQELQNTISEKEKQSQNLAVADLVQFVTKAVDEYGMSPRKVADITFEAIRENRFYILTHPDKTIPNIRLRMENIIEGRNPSPTIR